MKIVCMIPARLGSKRIFKKNIRIINGKPLITYIIEAALKANIFDDIYINSEADVFNDIANDYGINFYKRDESLANDNANNEDFLTDFIQNINCDYLVQLLPTSPLLKHSDINSFVDYLISNKLDTLISVNNHQIACLYKNKPINYSLYEAHKSSQRMTPIISYATVLMGWDKKNYLNNIHNHS